MNFWTADAIDIVNNEELKILNSWYNKFRVI